MARILAFSAVLWCCHSVPVFAGSPPAQKLPSAFLVFPYLEVGGAQDTRVEIVNLSGDSQELQCFYLDGGCFEVGFIVSLTPYQPIAWLASEGFSNTQNGSAVPPFFGEGELKCAVVAARPDVAAHNTVQGRATIFSADGSTVSYGAVGFQRLSDGDFTGTVSLNGSTYAQCPDKLHFDVLTDQPTSMSDIILVPCSEDLLFQTPTTIGVQFLIIDEFEESFSASISVTCFERRTLSSITSQLDRATLGSDTAHLIIRGTNGPLLGLVVDRVPGARTAGNEPSFQGGRSATVIFP